MANPIVMETISTALYTYLTADSTFNTEIGGGATTAGRLRSGMAEDNISTPYAVFSFISDVFWDSFDQAGTQIRVQITCYRDHEDGIHKSLRMGDYLRSRLHRGTLTIGNHEPLSVEFDIARGPFREDELWRYDQDYMIRLFRT